MIATKERSWGGGKAFKVESACLKHAKIIRSASRTRVTTISGAGSVEARSLRENYPNQYSILQHSA